MRLHVGTRGATRGTLSFSEGAFLLTTSLRVGLLVCALLLHPTAIYASDDVDPGTVPGKVTSSWFLEIPSGGRLRVVNPFGDVHARFGGYEDQAEILATSQRLETDRPELEVRLSSGDAQADVLVAYSRPVEHADTRDRIDLVVFVPQGVTLDVRTHDGRIEVKGLHGNVTASSLTGSIHVRSVSGRVRTKSARGDIVAHLETGVTGEPQELATETGSIEVWLWEDANLDVDLWTSGEISTDYSLSVEHQRFEEPSKHAVAVVGEGGAALSLKSKQGNLRLLRLFKHFKREP